MPCIVLQTGKVIKTNLFDKSQFDGQRLYVSKFMIMIYFALFRFVSSTSKEVVSHTVYEPPDEEGRAPTFLITHGLLGSKYNWNSIAKACARATNRRVISFLNLMRTRVSQKLYVILVYMCMVGRNI